MSNRDRKLKYQDWIMAKPNLQEFFLWDGIFAFFLLISSQKWKILKLLL